MLTTLFVDIKSLVTNDPIRLNVPEDHITPEDLGVVSDGAILVDETGVIQWSGRRSEAPRAKRYVKLNAEMVIPGFVECHSHPLFFDGQEDEVSSETLKTYRGIPIEEISKLSQDLSDDDLLVHVYRRLNKALSRGITTLEAKTGFGLYHDRERRLLQLAQNLRVNTPQQIKVSYLGAHAIPSQEDPNEYVEALKKNLVNWYKEGLFDFFDLAIDDGQFPLQIAEDCMEFANEKHAIPFRVHADRLRGQGTARRATSLSAFSATHLNFAFDGAPVDDTISHFTRFGTIPILTPAASFNRDLPFAKAEHFLAGNVRVALSTGYNPLDSRTFHVPFVMNLAVNNMHIRYEEALAGFTIQAARALESNTAGYVGLGSRADFQVYDADYRKVIDDYNTNYLREVYCGGMPQFHPDKEIELKPKGLLGRLFGSSPTA